MCNQSADIKETDLREAIASVTDECKMCHKPKTRNNGRCWSCYLHSPAAKEDREYSAMEERYYRTQAEAEKLIRDVVADRKTCNRCGGWAPRRTFLGGWGCWHCFYKGTFTTLESLQLDTFVEYFAEIWMQRLPLPGEPLPQHTTSPSPPVRATAQQEQGPSAVATAPALPAPTAPAWTATYGPDEWGW